MNRKNPFTLGNWSFGDGSVRLGGKRNLGGDCDWSLLAWPSCRRQAWSYLHRPLRETPLSLRLLRHLSKKSFIFLCCCGAPFLSHHSVGATLLGEWEWVAGLGNRGHWAWRELLQKVLANQCLILFELEGDGHFWSEGILHSLFMERVQKGNQEEKSEWVCCEVKSSVTFVTG